MWYRIIVAHEKTGHVFATAPESINGRHEYQELYKLLTEKFPASEGYSLHASRWVKRGEFIDADGETIKEVP